MSAPPHDAPDPRASARATIPLVFWLLIMVCMGLAIGLWSPWRDRSDRAPARPLEDLIAGLEDPAQQRRAYLYLKDWGPSAGPRLLEAARDEGFGARHEAIELLGRLRYQPALPYLLALEEPQLREARLVAAGRIGGPEATALLRETLAGPEVELKFAALRVLADQPDLPAEACDEALAFLTHEAFGLRELAAEFCGRQRYGPALEPLKLRLEDAHGDVRNKAAWALMQLGEASGVAAVEAAIERGRVSVER
ncbi:MAG TPA: hypothetical protein DEA08_25780 [Planctomycetes bacterium]|nr:hypothetical protein [Planctomycetota bacterium]